MKRATKRRRASFVATCVDCGTRGRCEQDKEKPDGWAVGEDSMGVYYLCSVCLAELRDR